MQNQSPMKSYPACQRIRRFGIGLSFPLLVLQASAPVTEGSLGDEPPDYIGLARETRRAWCTAEVEWSVTDHRGSSVTQYFTTRNAGEDAIWIRRGDVMGRQYADAARPAGRGEGDLHLYSERRTLIKDNMQYAYTEHSATARMAGGDDARNRQPFVDIHMLGFWPSPTHMASWDSIAWNELGPYALDRDASDRVVISATPKDGVVYRWVLDPSLGYQPTECSYTRNGEVLYECVLTYTNLDRPYPSRAEFRERGELDQSISILSARFDDPLHPSQLSPDMLGIPVGASVTTGGVVLVWDGRKPIPIQEAHARRVAGELDFTTIEKLLADHKEGRSQGRTPTSDGGVGAIDSEIPADDPILWAEFVRRFIRTFRLTSDQVEKAWEIHATCRADAIAYLRERRTEFESVASKLAKETSFTTPDEAQRRAELIEEQRRLRAPVARLFEERLRPRLVSLLTPRQKEEAIQEETAKPGSTGIRQLLDAVDHDRAIRQAESGERPK